MYKLITFDANGTLFKLRYPVGQIYSAAAEKFGLDSDSSKLNRGFKVNWVAMNELHPNFGESTIGWRNWWRRLVCQSFLESQDDKNSVQHIEPVADQLIEMFSSDEGWDLAEGSLLTLDKLKSKNIPLGVISNSDPRLHSVLKSLKIHDYFDFVLTSYEMRVMKPDIKIFRAAEQLSKLDFKNKRTSILHVGDNFEFDYLGPLKADWDAALITPNKDTLLSKHPEINNKKVFENLFKFCDYIEQES